MITKTHLKVVKVVILNMRMMKLKILAAAMSILMILCKTLQLSQIRNLAIINQDPWVEVTKQENNHSNLLFNYSGSDK